MTSAMIWCCSSSRNASSVTRTVLSSSKKGVRDDGGPFAQNFRVRRFVSKTPEAPGIWPWKNTIHWVVPPPSKSHHQDYYILSRTRIITFWVGNPYKPSFPLLLGGGTTQTIRMKMPGNHRMLHLPNNQKHQIQDSELLRSLTIANQRHHSSGKWKNPNLVN